VIDGEIGEFVTIAREERETGKWFLGAVTNEDAREITIKTDFLQPGITYSAIIYEDGKNAHWDKNPGAYHIRNLRCNNESELALYLAPGGGVAISFLPEN
jgi:glucan 1,4-alpha-glucosidase